MALTPEYLQGLPEELENLTMQFEADIIADISRRIAKAGAVTDTAEYQMMLLKEMGASTEYLEKLIAQYTGLSDAAVKQMIFDAAQTDSDFYRSVYARVNRPYVPFEYNEYLQQLADAAVNQTCGELSNFTRSMGFSTRGTDGRIYFTPAADTYRVCMDKAHLYTAAGMDYRSACRMATAGITAAGLQFVDYASGVRNHADVAVRRALLTGVSQMTGQISLRNAQALDTDVVEVSAHAGARPDHAAWQGRWFSLSGKDRRYPQLAAATGYGTVSGLKGANCRHDFYPVIPGIDEPAYTEEQLRNIDPPPVTIDGRTYTYYEAEQRQRAFERAIRKTKREIIAADASGDEELFTAKSVLLRRQKEAYGEFSKQAGLLPRIERTGVAEYGRSISAKAVWADRKANISAAAGLTSDSSGGKIKGKIKNAADRVKEVIHDLPRRASYSELPADYRTHFESGLAGSHDIVKDVVAKVRDSTNYVVSDNKKSFYSSFGDYVKINLERPPSTMAHELFHKYDAETKFTQNAVFDKALDKDYAALKKVSGGDIKQYLFDKYPDAFTFNQFDGNRYFKPKYRGISDIISGITNDDINLGFHHEKEYWEANSSRKVKEAFAQTGRIYYDNDPDVIAMFKELFPSFSHNVLIKLSK